MPFRSDLLKVCNDQGVSEEDFRLAFCDRCQQTECTRSRLGDSKFERRTSSWYETLFSNVPRLDPQDPRYVEISAKNFLTIDPGPVPEIRTSSSWDEPSPPVSVPQQDPTPTSEHIYTTITKPMVVGVGPGQVQELPQLNTPSLGFQRIGSAPPVPAPPPSPTTPVPAPQHQEVVLKPGARVRIGV